jgi:hypothetical protein
MESTNIIEAYSPEWWKQRHGCFTGSEAWKLMSEPKSKKVSFSVTAETYILEKVWEYLSQSSKTGVDNFATQWGVENEPLAKKWYTKITGNEIQESHLVFKEGLSGFSGTPDGFIGEDGLIEIKCPYNGANHLKHCMIESHDWFKSEHKEYYWQVQSYLFLTGRKWCDFVSFDPRINSDFGFFKYRIMADFDDCELLEIKVKTARIKYLELVKTFSDND